MSFKKRLDAAYDKGYGDARSQQFSSYQDYFLNQLLKNTEEKKQLKELINDLIKQNNELLAKIQDMEGGN